MNKLDIMHALMNLVIVAQALAIVKLQRQLQAKTGA